MSVTWESGMFWLFLNPVNAAPLWKANVSRCFAGTTIGRVEQKNRRLLRHAFDALYPHILAAAPIIIQFLTEIINVQHHKQDSSILMEIVLQQVFKQSNQQSIQLM
ncbi:MAG: hypothetical protein EZS28_052570 [Streblomastix strix]|uniref:Uncharacterized protein n=1 Tax=Streblomastix strix TaxID=222440 RepID=A0A5J4S1L0_9EUKA|nr:MAG: hypothetical protein EZS28_052570 [Streblomastix strix]